MSGQRDSITIPARKPGDDGPTRVDRVISALPGAPLLPPALGLCLGVLLDYGCPLPFFIYVGVFVAAGVGLPALRERWLACAGVILAAAVGVGGSLHHAAYRRARSNHIVRYTKDESIHANVTGTIVAEPSISRPDGGAFGGFVPRSPRTRFLVEVEQIDGVSGPIAAGGLLRVGVAEPVLYVQAGDRVRMIGRLYRPVPPANPGEHDWVRSHRRQGVLAGLSCEHAACVTPLGRAGGWLPRFRQYCRRLLLDNVATTDTTGLSVLEAIILGQRSTVDRAINDAFVATGTVHILSVSGAHLGMLGGTIWALAALAGRSRRQSALLVLVAILAYALLAEPNAPVVRSAITATFLCIGLLSRRPARTANWLAASAMLVLAIRPTDLFDPGFQLSYVTLFGVIYLSGPVRDVWRTLLFRHDEALDGLIPPPPTPQGRRRILRSAGRSIETALAVSLAAWLVGAPLGLYHFGQSSVWGWFNSLLIAPAVAVLMALGLAKVIVSALWPSLGMFLGSVVAIWTEWVTDWVRLWAAVPGVSVITAPPPLWLVLSALAVFVVWTARRALAISGHWIGVGLFACVVCAFYWHLPGRHRDSELRVHVLAVGDGAATVIRFPNGRAMMYDCGTTPPRELYRSILCVAMNADRVRWLDAVVVSHPNIDHYSGVPELAARVPIGGVYLTSHFVKTGAASGRGPVARLMRDLGQRRIPVGQVHAGDHILNTGGVAVEVLWPPPADEYAPSDSNDTSVVLRLRSGGRSILLTGDIEREPQRWLMEHVDLRSDVLILPHHGSFKPWTADFVRAVSPTYVIRSSGRRRELGPAGLNDLMRHYAYFNTADDGAVLVRLAADGIRVSARR